MSINDMRLTVKSGKGADSITRVAFDNKLTAENAK